MTKTDELVDQAEQKLEKHDFVGARDDYRRAGLEEPLDLNSMFNLSIAEERECLQFRTAVRKKHPTSFNAYMAEATFNESIHNNSQAIRLYSELLNSFENDSSNVINIRNRRFGAICASLATSNRDEYITFLLEDFWTLWEMGEENTQAKYRRPSLLRILAKELNDSDDIPILERFVYDDRIPASIIPFFHAKIEELRALSQALDMDEVKIKRG